jgi:hypothetical protein
MGEEILSPAWRTLAAQLEAPRVLCGVEQGRWSIRKLAWPHLYVRVTGRDLESGWAFAHDFHLECEGYPDPGPFVERWSFEDSPPFGSRPPPPSVGSPGFIDAMKDWSCPGQSAAGIYRAWQRLAVGHNDWARKRPCDAWHRNRDISFILEHLYALVSEQAVWLASRQ